MVQAVGHEGPQGICAFLTFSLLTGERSLQNRFTELRVLPKFLNSVALLGMFFLVEWRNIDISKALYEDYFSKI